MVKIRRTLNVTPEFRQRLKKIQGKIKAENGEEPSLTDLTGTMIKLPSFQDIEKELININVETDIGLGIKFDGSLR